MASSTSTAVGSGGSGVVGQVTQLLAALRAGLLTALRAALMLALLTAWLGGGCGRPAPARPAGPKVAAAADLAFAFAALGRVFEEEHGRSPTFIFGSTGLLARQLAEGAPYDVYAAANERFVDQVIRTGACDGTTKARYGRGRLVVWTRDGQGGPPARLADLGDPRFRRIAIANPEHAPYGHAARQALQRAGLGEALRPRVVHGENVRQALQYAQSGNAEAAVVALSLGQMTPGGRTLLVDEQLHDPIDQALVVCRRGNDEAGGRAFARLVLSPSGQAILRRHGFLGATASGQPVRP